MSNDQEAVVNREDRIAECFQTVIELEKRIPAEARKSINCGGLLDFLTEEYNNTRATARNAAAA